MWDKYVGVIAVGIHSNGQDLCQDPLDGSFVEVEGKVASPDQKRFALRDFLV